MGQYSYVTNRTLKNKAEKETGKLRAFVLTGSNIAEVDYTCPECLFSEHTKAEFKRPFSVKCSKCGFLLRILKIKDEIKKEKKKG